MYEGHLPDVIVMAGPDRAIAEEHIVCLTQQLLRINWSHLSGADW